MLFTLTPSAPAEGYGEAIVPIVAVKQWLNVVGDAEDELIGALRDVGINAVEQYTNVRMGPMTGLVATFDGFCDRMRPGVGPSATLTVTGINYLDGAGDEASIDAGRWRVGPDGGIAPAIGSAWPSGARQVAVTFDAGYPADTCPANLITAVKMFAAHLYANREAVVVGPTTGELPMGFRMLCDPYRMPVI